MTEDKQQVVEIVRFVEKDFLINNNNSLIPATDLASLEEFRKYLTEKIKILLDEKFDTLVNVLYRIDISEKKLKSALLGKKQDSIPSNLQI